MIPTDEPQSSPDTPLGEPEGSTVAPEPVAAPVMPAGPPPAPPPAPDPEEQRRRLLEAREAIDEEIARLSPAPGWVMHDNEVSGGEPEEEVSSPDEFRPQYRGPIGY